MKVREIMRCPVRIVSPDASVQEAAEVMREADVGALPVLEGDLLVGMLTDRDIVRRSTAKGQDPNEVRVRTVMTNDMVHLYQDQDVLEAARLMDIRQIRRLLILDDNKRLVGILSVDDFAHHPELRELAGLTLNRVSQTYETEATRAGVLHS
jgi:CBS domain-containing protein